MSPLRPDYNPFTTSPIYFTIQSQNILDPFTKPFLSTTVVFMLKCFYMHPTGAHLHPNANKYPATWVMTHNLPCHGSQTRPCFHLMTIITSQKVMAPIPGQKCAKKTSQTHENDQATIKTRYCGHLYSPLLRKWTYWSQRGWVSYCMREG